jgi:predicted RNase H-like HicB family nuclease
MRRVLVAYHHESDGWWAESPDVPGWTAAGESFDEVRDLAREGLAFFLEEEVSIEEIGIPTEAAQVVWREGPRMSGVRTAVSDSQLTSPRAG